MLDFNFIRWRIELRTRRKKNRVKRNKNERVMLVSVKSGDAGNMQQHKMNLLSKRGLGGASSPPPPPRT
ncbi:hypothetical protein HanHA300_Chr07g0234131 [Helianthus annuus]|nr:hypothetical protein HanHA300_Chr07g0234131 [Helianthus annuus]